MMISFSAMADYENELKLANALQESNLVIEQLSNQVEKLMKVAASQGRQITEWRGYTELIAESCLDGRRFASMDSKGVMYHFDCEVVE